MSISELVGLPADPSSLVDVEKLVGAYYELRPDPCVNGNESLPTVLPEHTAPTLNDVQIAELR